LRYAIISDLHANLEATECVLERIQELSVDATYCLGDVVGYNASPNECCNLMRELNIPTVLGNHDAVACGLEEPWGFNPVALSAALWTRDSLTEDNRKWLISLPDSRQIANMLLVHGSPFDRDFYMFTWDDVLPYVSYLEESVCDVCFFGHTHSPGIFAGDGVYSIDERAHFSLGNGKAFFINPGSVGQPRDGDPRASFGLYDTETKEYEHVRVEYPVEEAAETVLSQGLPPFLAERLLVGR
jgi:predicted phosphodiesterase